ncbi:hypothetical protein GF325_07620 [Candidatus Bathyarchaeota archaeon]|nr:hypothetical protein [Candidatus Bathyarchaeota archaeon]
MLVQASPLLDLLVPIILLILLINVMLAILIALHASRSGDMPGTWFGTITLLGAFGVAIYLFRQAGIIDKVVRVNTVFSRISTGIALMLTIMIYGAFQLFGVSQGLVTLPEIWPALSLALTLAPCLFLLGWIGASNRVGSLFSFLAAALGVYATWDLMYGDPDGFLVPGFTIIKWILFGLMTGGGLLALFNFFCMWFTPANSYKVRLAYRIKLKRQFKKHGKIVIGTAIACMALGSIAIVSQFPSMYRQSFTITPRDYHAKIAFWGRFEYDAYNTTERTELNQHNCTIIFYNTPDIRYASKRQEFIDNMTAWNTSYPNVSFIAAIPGITRINNTGDDMKDFLWGGFAWDGAVEGTIKYAKEYVFLAQANNLTNFKGINTDQESPSDKLATQYGIDIGPDRGRHDQAIDMYNDFFAWMDLHAPTMFLTSTMGNEPFLDMQDGDNDLHHVHMWNVLDVDGWHELAPMIYRCGYRGKKPYGGFDSLQAGIDVDGSIEVYNKLKYLNNSLHKVDGHNDRLGIYLGITNCSCYGRDVEQYEQDGTYLGKGYDELVKDALIAKHFGSRIITLFILDTVVEKGYSMGGVFDTWALNSSMISMHPSMVKMPPIISRYSWTPMLNS